MRNKLSRCILSNNTISKIFRVADEGQVYLVGGFVRDILVHGNQSKDIDFAVNNDHHAFAMKVAASLGGKAIELKKELLVRVMLPDRTTLDFAPMQGSISDDLKKRDFTMNALAWSPKTGVIDVVGAMDDIGDRRISAIDKTNFINDPLRILRAYRFVSEFGWTIPRRTRGYLRACASGLSNVANERITLELYRTLSADGVNKALNLALNDQVLEEIITNDYSALNHNVKLISRIWKKLKTLPQLDLDGYNSGILSSAGLIYLEALLIGSDRHKLSLSYEIKKRVSLTRKLLDKYRTADFEEITNEFNLFVRAGFAATDIAILAEKWGLLDRIEHFKRIDNFPLLGAKKIMDLTGISEGPDVGRYLQKLKELEFTGKLRTPKEAQDWLSYQHAI